MGQPVRGDVVVVPFPFTNLSAGKIRPAFVVSAPVPGEALLCQITTVRREDGYSVLLAKSDFAVGKLDHDCYARVNHLFTVDIAVIQRTAGRLKDSKTVELLERIIEAIRK